MTAIDERLMWSYTVLEGNMNVLPRFHELHPVVSTFVKTFHPKTQMWTSVSAPEKSQETTHHLAAIDVWIKYDGLPSLEIQKQLASSRVEVVAQSLLLIRCLLPFHWYWYWRYIQTPWQMNPPLPPHHLLPKPNRIFPVGENMSDMDSVLLCSTQLHERETPDNFQRIRSVWTLISRVKTTTDWVWKVFSFSVRKKKVLVLNKWISTTHRDTWCSR